MSTKKGVNLSDRVKGALYGLLIADALAKPTHWFYGGRSQVLREWGEIKGYIDIPANKTLYGSIMGKSNTGGGGRGDDKGSIIGDVINHGKKQFWASGSQYHYHQGLKAGENTLEACLTRNAIATVVKDRGAFVPEDQLKAYISFMTTENSHNDTYASTSHRMFFKNLVERKLPPEQCPDNDHHNNVATGALIGALLGAAAGFDRIPSDLISGLAPGADGKLKSNIDDFTAAVPFCKAASY
eukprot:g815.t1